MPRYLKRSSKNDYYSRHHYEDVYKVMGNEKQPDNPNERVPFGMLNVAITREHTYPNFNLEDNAADSSLYEDVSRHTGVSDEYIGDLARKGAYIHDDYHSFRDRGTSDARVEGIAYGKYISQIKKDEQYKPTELFTTLPKSVEITGATFNPSLKSSFLTIGALIHQEHGVPITSSDSLSKWSSAVSRNAKNKGLPVVGHENNPNMDITNVVDYAEGEPLEAPKRYHSTFSPIPEQEIRSARLHLRGLLGKEPKQHMSNQFTNVPLPGMENF